PSTSRCPADTCRRGCTRSRSQTRSARPHAEPPHSRARTYTRSTEMLALYVIAALFGALAVLNLVVGRLPRKPDGGGGVIETAHGPIHYVETVGEGTPIVFIHGMPGSCRDFDRVRAELDGRHTIAFDRPGYAWSEGPPQEFGTQLDSIVEAASTLGVER